MTTLNIARPTPAAPNNFVLGSGVKTAVIRWDLTTVSTDSFEVWANSVDDIVTATKVATVSTNFFSLGGVSSDTYFWVRVINSFNVVGAFTASVLCTPGVITSADTTSTAPTSISSSVGSSASSTTIGSYNTWTSAGYASFNASENSYVTISIACFVQIGSVSGTGLQVLVRSRLYDVTLGVDVPAGTKTYIIYANNLTPYGALNQIVNLNESFISGFRGLITPGHDYRLYAEVQKKQASGTPTASVTIGSSVTSSGAASI